MRFDGRAAAAACAAAAGLPGGERLRTWALRARQPQQQARALADGDGRWDREGQRGGGEGAGGWDGAAAEGTDDPSHPHGLNVSVFHGNVDVAMRKLRRKVIVEGVMKKFKKNRYNVRPAEQRKIAGDVGLRRMERRRMRTKLKHVWVKMNAMKIDH